MATPPQPEPSSTGTTATTASSGPGGSSGTSRGSVGRPRVEVIAAPPDDAPGKDKAPVKDDAPETLAHELRRAWKPVKNGPAALDAHRGIRVRLHRCFSWIRRAEDVASTGLRGTEDAVLIHQWIAFNALYGRWDVEQNTTAPDRQSIDAFISLILRHDGRDGRLQRLMQEHKKLAEVIVGDRVLMRHFWKNPEPVFVDDARPRPRDLFSLRDAIREKRTTAALDYVLQRIYFLRCQMVHGGATCGGDLNRKQIHRAVRFMWLLLPQLAYIIIEKAWNDPDAGWQHLCYPPLR